MSTNFSLQFKLNQIQAPNPSHGSTSDSGKSAWPQSQSFMWAKSSSKSHQPFPEIWVAFCSLCISPPSTTCVVTDHSSLTGRSLIFMPFHHFKGFTDLLYQLCLLACFQPSSLLRKSSYSHTIKFNQLHHHWFSSPQNLAHWTFDTENWMQGKWKTTIICYFIVFHINALHI